MTLDLFDRPSTADTGQRSDFDLYETAPWMVASLLAHHPIDRKALVFEPTCGSGSIVRAVLAAGFRTVLSNDVDKRHDATWYFDATAAAFWALPALSEVEWVIGNPPFLIALPIVQHAIQCARVGVALLLRKTFLEPTAERGPWLAAHPPSRVIGLPRHSFRGKGNDSVSCDWMIWEREPDRSLPPIVVDHLAKTRRTA